MSKALLHFHTEASRYDSAATVRDMCKRAKDLGYTSVGITEHGVVTSTFDFMDICRELDLQPIPGVEVYVGMEMKSHMCLFAKSDKGFKGISKLVSESFQILNEKHPEYNGKNSKPIVTLEMLEKYFGKNSEYNGEVIASSACVKGILCDTLNQNAPILKQFSKLKEKAEVIEVSEEAEAIHNIILKNEARLKEISATLKEVKKIANLKTTKEERCLAKFVEGEDGYNEAKENLEAKRLKIKEAEQQVLLLTKEKEAIAEYKKLNKKTIDAYKSAIAKQIKNEASLDEMENQIKSEEECYSDMIAKMCQLRTIFDDDFYIELQYHGVDIEKQYMPVLLKVAKEYGIKWIVTNDAHMVGNTKNEIIRRDFIRGMRYSDVYYPMDAADSELYIKTEEEMIEFLSQIFPREDIITGLVENGKLAEKCNVNLDHENHYPVFTSEIKDESSADCLKRLCLEGMKKKFTKETWTEEYQKRLDYELNIIISMGYADYHCIVADYIQYGLLIGKIDFSKYEEEYYKNPYDRKYLEKLVKDTNGVGIGIGPGRGSAAGSLVCYLIGITQLDPIKYNLLFERFLNPERVSMPDIDVDFNSDIREKTIDYVRYKYGDEAVCMILTVGTLKAKKAIRNVARVYGLKKYNDNIYFRSLADTLCKNVPNELNIKFKDFLYDVEEKDEQGNSIIREGLMTKFADNEDAKFILKVAELLEDTFIDYGMHAAGVVISDGQPVSDYLPLMCNDAENVVCQCTKERVEEYGLLKMDFLGLKNLRVITNALRLIEKRTGNAIQLNEISFDNKEVFKLYSNGKTKGIFQVEADGITSFCKNFQPTSFEDIILILAAYRPGPMSFIPNIIDVKKGRKSPDYVIPEMKEVLGVTYGYPIYQEQLMEIFHRFANFSLGEADMIRRYMSKKKVEKFLSFKDKFVAGLVSNGADKEKSLAFWDDLVDFAKYAFNKSHAAVYAVVSYWTAWIKRYYPREYFCAFLDDLNTDNFAKKNGAIRKELKSLGYKVVLPDINIAQRKWSIHENDVVYGFDTIRSVSDGTAAIVEEREKNGPFTSVQDFIIRITPDKKMLTGLFFGGAFDSICPRYLLADTTLIEHLADLSSNLKRARKNEKNVEKITNEILNFKIETSLKDEDYLLKMEKFYLGGYFSKNLLDTLPEPGSNGCHPIAEHKLPVCGIISNLRIVQRRADNMDMAFFELEDNSGSIKVNCYTKCYAKYKGLIQENKAVKIDGFKIEKQLAFGAEQTEENADDEDIYEYVISSPTSITNITTGTKQYRLEVKNMIEWQEKYLPMLSPYEEKCGYQIIIYDKLTKRMRKSTLIVSDEGIRVLKESK